MIDGYLKVAAITPNVRVADVEFNCNEICKCIEEAAGKKVKLMVFPELCITGYTCQDLFFQDRLLEATKEALLKIAKHSQGVDALIFVGLPLSVDAKLYNVAVALSNGEILGIVPKTFLPNYNEFYEARHFYSGRELDTVINIGGRTVQINRNILFVCNENCIQHMRESNSEMPSQKSWG
jgi:NAD+ synthase (glutamine-hydrolysing)